MAKILSEAKFVIWFTGLPCSGKTTLAEKLETLLRNKSLETERIDGDCVRTVLENTGFSPRERDLHIRYVGWAASRLADHGIVPIVSLVSPAARSRTFARSLARNFFEIYVATPLHVCEQRDTKGHYLKARRGEISDFTGVSADYDVPVSPELIVDTSTESADEISERIWDALQAKGYVNG